MKDETVKHETVRPIGVLKKTERQAVCRWHGPFRNTSLLMMTIVILPSSGVPIRLCLAGCSAGTKTLVSTAFGITDILWAGSLARNAVFSLLVCETQMACATFFRLYLNSLLVKMAEASENPKIEWSVNIAFNPMAGASESASLPSVEKAAWACTICICSRIKMCLKRAAETGITVGNVTEL